MTGLIVLRGMQESTWSFPFQDVEIVRDPEALLERIRDRPGKIQWIAIAPDIEDSPGVAQRVREADPLIGVILLGAYGESEALQPSAPLPEMRATQADDSQSASGLAPPRLEQVYIRTLLDTVDTVIILVGLDGTIREWNRQAESLYGVSRVEAVGRPYSDFIPDEERDRVRADIERLTADGKPTESLESAITTPDGIRYLLWNAALVRDEQGEPGILATGIDFTKRKQAERALQETKRRALEAEKLAAITSLTAGITHDVGTPMTAILGYAELIAKSVEDEKNRKRASTIVEQVHRVSGLLETLMNLSRLEERPPRPLELAGILDRALDFYREKFKRHGVQIERDYGPAPQILGDPDRLHQVLLSLFVSALEAMPEGGTLRLRLGETDEADAEIRVSDTGTSIDRDVQSQVFEPHFPAKRGSNGTSIGILVAKTIVEEHGGRITLTSGSDHATEFHLTFPRLGNGAL